MRIHFFSRAFSLTRLLPNLFLALSIFLSQNVLGQNHPKVSIGLVPNWHQKNSTANNDPISNNEVNTGYSFQTLEYDINVVAKTTVTRIRKKVLTSDGLQACGNISINFDPTYQKLIIHSVGVIRKGVISNRLNEKTFNIIQQERSSESYIYDGALTAFCILDDIRVGDEVEFVYSRIGRNPLEKGRYSSTYYFSYSEPIGEVSYRLTVSASDSIRIKQTFFESAPAISENGGTRSYLWYVPNAKETKADNESVSGYDPYARVQVSTYKDWAEVAAWAIPHYDTSIPPKSELAKWVEDKKNAQKSTEELIQSAIKQVQQNIRYLGLEAGISAYKPHPVDEVFANKYGDCKDKSLLLVSILNQFGVTAYPALVNSSIRDSLANKLPSPYVFDHCIVVAEFQNKNVWIDPTSSSHYGPLDRITTPDYGKALVIKSNAADLVDMEIRATDAVETIETFTSTATDAPVTLKVTTNYTGYSASRMRNYFKSTIHSNVSDAYLDFYARMYPEIELVEQFKLEDDSAINIITVHESYIISGFWIATDSTVGGATSCEFYPKTLSNYLNSPSDPIRTSRYRLNYPMTVRHVIIADLHEEWNIDPVNNRVTAPGLTYSSSINKTGNQIKMVYNLRTTRSYVEADEIPRYVTAIDQIWDDMGYSLWHPGRVEATTTSFGLIVFSILAAIGFVFGCWKYHRSFDPISKSTDSKPKDFGGWLILPMFGLTITPLILGYSLITGGYFNSSTINLFIETSPSFNMAQGTLVIGEMVWNVFFIVFSVFTAFQLYTKRSSAPKWVIVFYAMNVVSISTDLFLADLIGIKFNEEDAKTIFKTLLGAAIWIPYFLKSERVKLTFTNQLRPQPLVNFVDTESTEVEGGN
ncbi:MAG: DUF2569 family protein [Flavobacteriales bacterium]|nr:DUF2569 family protein [Flavobacteriales bacterium]